MIAKYAVSGQNNYSYKTCSWVVVTMKSITAGMVQPVNVYKIAGLV
jgi:hypothetical protein